MPTTSVSGATSAGISLAFSTTCDGSFISEWLTISDSEKRASSRGLNSCTFWRAICARRTRRMSSSLLPLNMLPVMTSMRPARPAAGADMAPRPLLGSLDVRAGAGVDADHVPLVDERRHLHHEPGLHLGRLADVRDGRALDRGLGLHHLHRHVERQVDADRAALVELDPDLDVRDQVRDGVAEHVVGEPDLLEGLVVHEVVHVAVLVEVLHLRLVQDRALDHVDRAEAVVA